MSLKERYLRAAENLLAAAADLAEVPEYFDRIFSTAQDLLAAVPLIVEEEATAEEGKAEETEEVKTE